MLITQSLYAKEAAVAELSYSDFQHKSLRIKDLHGKTLLIKNGTFGAKTWQNRLQTRTIKKSFQQGKNQHKKAKKRPTCVKEMVVAPQKCR
ncbi:MAG: hypothetical protein IJV69_06025 [Kiritimatiellae bacterium]|nr:hypothetical protein [Kiritimatiellia bacterium]